MTSNAAIPTLSDLLSLSDSQYRIFDIGRKIDKISKEYFTKIEHNQVPYPFPSQGHAFIAIAFWQKKATSPYLWFVKLPLDERGLLNLVARDHFIAIIIEALGSDITVDPTEQQEALLKNNPYHFTPSQYKLAALNSKIKGELKQAPSEYFNHSAQYFSGTLAWDDWHKIGVQGITDFAARINEKDYDQQISQAIPHIASEVLLPLCSALENEKLSPTLIEALLKRAQQPECTDIELQHLLRSIASNCQHPHVVSFIENLLKQKGLSDEVLIVLSGRCWAVWQTPSLLVSYFEQIIAKQDMPLFHAIFKDLVAIPLIRPQVFQCMRDPSRSSALSHAIGLLFHTAESPVVETKH